MMRGQWAVYFFLLICACKSKEVKQDQAESLANVKAGSLSCSKGFVANDSMAYVEGGGAAFDSTIVYPHIEVKVPAGMVLIPGGEFSMGGVDPTRMQGGGKEAMNDARPIHRVKISPFLMDATEVTNDQFAAFVKATGYVTLAEKNLHPKNFLMFPRKILWQGLSCSRRLRVKYRSIIICSGGVMKMELTGSIHLEREVISRVKAIILLCMYPGRMRWPMQSGPAKDYQRRQNGSLPHVADRQVMFMHGAIHTSKMANTWPILFRVLSQIVMPAKMAIAALHR